MTDYIKRKDALNAAIADDMTYDEALSLSRRIANIPSADVVEVVRCVDCKFSYETAEFVNRVLTPVCCCSKGAWLDCIVPETFFCKYGERKEGHDEAD